MVIIAGGEDGAGRPGGQRVRYRRSAAGMTGQLDVRRASAADTDSVTSIITLAFARDPLWARAMASPHGGTAHHGDFWRLFIEGALRYPCTWMTSGGEATSVWIPPGGTEMTPEQEQRLADLATNRLGDAAGGYLELISRFDAAHPRAGPHYYLSLLAAHPDHRGKGIGIRLLAHDLEQIDAEHLPAYLESSNPPALMHRSQALLRRALGTAVAQIRPEAMKALRISRRGGMVPGAAR